MKYLFLAYNDEKWWEALSAGEHNAFKDDCLVNNEILRQNGHLLAGEGLHGNSAATTVRVAGWQGVRHRSLVYQLE